MLRFISDVWDSLTGENKPLAQETGYDVLFQAVALAFCIFVITISVHELFKP